MILCPSGHVSSNLTRGAFFIQNAEKLLFIFANIAYAVHIYLEMADAPLYIFPDAVNIIYADMASLAAPGADEVAMAVCLKRKYLFSAAGVAVQLLFAP
jgi:hypothetical protein